MAVLRAFIAIDLPEDIHQRLEQVSSNLQQQLAGMPVRWVPIDKVHLTLKFLGDVSETNVEMVTKIIATESANQRPFEISIGSLGVFPNVRRPRVIWVGVEAAEDLNTLQRRIEAEVARLGYAPDDRPFSPHLTIGRVSRNAGPAQVRAIGDLLRKEKLGFLGAARVSHIHLYRSDLKPGGAVYTRLFTAQLIGS